MKNLTLRNILAATGGEFFGNEADLDTEVSSIVRDNREAVNGSVFAAIVGERVDGHRFAQSAFDAGAICCLGQHVTEAQGNFIVVPSTLTALQQIAAFYRSQFTIPFVGITGSVGKTTAKEMVSAVLAEHFNVLKTKGNLNNELGVPLTLFSVNEEHTCAVLEMGINHFGEMSRLTAMVRPDIALFTIIGDAHLEFLGDRQGVLRAKGEILEGMSDDGTVIINGDDPILCTLQCKQKILSYGKGENCDVRAENIRMGANFETLCDIVCGERCIPVTISAFGEHMIYAALEGAACGIALGLTDEEISGGITKYATVGSRANLVKTPHFTLLDDCYNANPTSNASAIASLMTLPGRKVCILGDMLELGETQEQLHYDIGVLAKEKGADLVITAGPLSAATARGAEGISRHFENTDELISALPELLKDGDAILVKASHSSRFEKVSEFISKI